MSIDAKVHARHFHLDGVGYYRTRAETVQLGDVGEKQTHGAPPGFLAVQASVPRHGLTIERASQVDLHRVAIAAGDIGAGITIPGVGSFGAATLARQLQDQTLSLVKLECLPKDIVAAANGSPAVIAALVRAGNTGRLVHQAFVALEMKTALNFTRSTRFDVSGGVGSWTITGTSGASRTAVTITPGTTFAYLLLEPKWNANGQAMRNWIDDWQDDPSSLH
jgi:hypothetical protein